jgi:hypothetical protein
MSSGCGPIPPIVCSARISARTVVLPSYLPLSLKLPRSTGSIPLNALPDLVPLPALGISTHAENGRDWLDFGATVYNAGYGPLVVEGFRHIGTATMSGYSSSTRTANSSAMCQRLRSSTAGARRTSTGIGGTSPDTT